MGTISLTRTYPHLCPDYIIYIYMEMWLQLVLSLISILTLTCYVLKETGEREGKFYAINVPLKDGIDDTSFTRLFKTVSCGKIPKFMIDVIY